MWVGLATVCVGVILLAGCSGGDPSAAPATSTSMRSADDPVLVPTGEWSVTPDQLPGRFGEGIRTNAVLAIQVTAYGDGRTAVGGIEVGFDGCSRLGGGVESFYPVRFTLPTIEGLGDCEDEDETARVPLAALDGQPLEFVDGELVVELEGVTVGFVRRGLARP
ncbi:MAG: hypothetical protein GY925_05715 [Actinomycetia bacterium]|nr:hypothetical protein [Actinomycetes bacterium]